MASGIMRKCVRHRNRERERVSGMKIACDGGRDRQVKEQ
jgi:hypothetical protein